MIRKLHLRSVRPARRLDPSNPFAARSDRFPQVRAKCGAWVVQRDAVRADRVWPDKPLCADCCAAHEGAA